LIGKWEVLKDDQLGARTAIIKKSQIALYPPNEYIYRASETAEEIFFIIWGKCEVHTSNGDLLYSLGQGQHFGDDFEGGKVGLRSTSVKACVKVSLAVIKLEDFLEICRFYP
jgi:CRP-like cAMP-binding protein